MFAFYIIVVVVVVVANVPVAKLSRQQTDRLTIMERRRRWETVSSNGNSVKLVINNISTTKTIATTCCMYFLANITKTKLQ